MPSMSMSAENSLREATKRRTRHEIERRDIARALARDARYVHARKASSASWCESVTVRGDHINRKTRRFVRVPPRICRDTSGYRSNPEMQYPRQIHTCTHIGTINCSMHQGVATLACILMRDIERSNGRCITAMTSWTSTTDWRLWKLRRVQTWRDK